RVINVYTDGASAGNGKASAKAGWGVWFEDPELQHLNRAGRLAGETQTNNRAELTAIIRACQLCPMTGAQLQIYTDSQYSVKAIQEWQQGWRRRGWRTSNAAAVLNKDLIRLLERELRKHVPRPNLIYVKGHAGHVGNEAADR
ncbi:ribonuclease H-like protein, partial [Tilletiopsis washingtonensis]